MKAVGETLNQRGSIVEPAIEGDGAMGIAEE